MHKYTGRAGWSTTYYAPQYAKTSLESCLQKDASGDCSRVDTIYKAADSSPESTKKTKVNLNRKKNVYSVN
jgi:hypothetical protein